MPTRPGRLIAGARRRSACRPSDPVSAAPCVDTRAHTSGDSKTAGRNARGMSGRAQHLVGPLPLRDVEHQRARRIGDVDGVLARQARSARSPSAAARAGRGPRRSGSCCRTHSSLVSVKFGSAGLQVSSSSRAAPIVRVQPGALLVAALIAPDDRRPDDVAGRIEQHGAVHLAGQADRVDGARRRCPPGPARIEPLPQKRASNRAGCCSAHAGPGRRERARGRSSPTRSSAPSSSTTIAREPLVPTSMPRTGMGMTPVPDSEFGLPNAQ